MAGFIIGFDNDKEDIFDRQIAFIQKNAIPKAMIGFLNALPGTRLYQRLLTEGRILKDSIGNNTHSMTTNFKTVMDAERMKEGYKKILACIYDFNLKNYFERCSRFLDNIEYTDYFQRKIHFNEVKILFKSIYWQIFTPLRFSVSQVCLSEHDKTSQHFWGSHFFEHCRASFPHHHTTDAENGKNRINPR